MALRGYLRLWEHHLPKPVKVVVPYVFHIELLADILSQLHGECRRIRNKRYTVIIGELAS